MIPAAFLPVFPALFCLYGLINFVIMIATQRQKMYDKMAADFAILLQLGCLNPGAFLYSEKLAVQQPNKVQLAAPAVSQHGKTHFFA